MHLVVNHARHQVTALRIDDLGPFAGPDVGSYLLDTITLDQYINVTNFALVDEAGICDQ